MAFLSGGCRRERSAKRFALALSLVVHGALAAGAATLATSPAAPIDEPIDVALLSDPPPPEVLVPDEPPTSTSTSDTVAAPQPRPVTMAARPAPTPARSKAVEPAPPAVAPEAPTAVEAAPPEQSATDDDAPKSDEPVLVASAGVSNMAGGGTGTGPGGGVAGMPGGRGRADGSDGAGRPLTNRERRALLDSYLKLIDPRIRQHFRYPREAEALELEGDVKIVLAVDRRGQLLRAQTTGRCPHAMLCEDAARTVRASVPFPPPPPELGAVVEVELPLTYRLE